MRRGRHRLVTVALPLVLLAAGMLLSASQTVEASAGDVDGWETGVWAITDYSATGQPNLNTATEIGVGFIDGLGSTSFGTNVDFRYNDLCKERHLRDPNFSVQNPIDHIWYPGNDQYSFDKSDVGMFVGHGGHDDLLFNTVTDRHNLYQETVRWGNFDLEWVVILACEWMYWYNTQEMYHDYSNMAGAHIIHGYRTAFMLMDQGEHQGRSTRGT